MDKPLNGLSLDFVDFDRLYFRQVSKKIDIRDLGVNANTSLEVAQELEQALRWHFEDDRLDTVPRCECGATSMASNLGIVCEICDEPVMRDFDRPLESQIWITPPEGVECFINPMWWNQFDDVFSNDTFSLINWLVDASYSPTRKNPNKETPGFKKLERTLEYLRSFGFERNLNYFTLNFDEIMDKVLTDEGTYFIGKNKRVRSYLYNDMRRIIDEFRNCIICRHLPYPSRLVLVSEQVGAKEFASKSIGTAIDAVKYIYSTINPITPLSEKQVNSRVVKGIKEFALFYTMFIKNSCSQKGGLFRQGTDTTRVPYGGRAVIVPIIGPHAPDELHVPYRWALTVLKLYVNNKLNARNYTPTQIYRLYDQYLVTFDEELYEVMELIREEHKGGIECATIRNPFLERLSIMLNRITRIHRDMTNNAIAISVCVIKGPNGDFDGDELMFQVPQDNYQRALYRRLVPELGFMNSDRPYEVKGIITLHPEALTLVNNFCAALRG